MTDTPERRAFRLGMQQRALEDAFQCGRRTDKSSPLFECLDDIATLDGSPPKLPRLDTCSLQGPLQGIQERDEVRFLAGS